VNKALSQRQLLEFLLLLFPGKKLELLTFRNFLISCNSQVFTHGSAHTARQPSLPVVSGVGAHFLHMGDLGP
jgi:hypothetical protein